MCVALTTTAVARLGDTLDQAEARYGLEKRQKVPAGRITLLEGAREVTFELEGWRIRCALLQATDGNFYVVREEYTKIWNGGVMKAGGVIQIRDFEREAILQAEGGSWAIKVLGEPGSNLLSSAANQLLRVYGVTNVWTRPDGAIARGNLSNVNVILDLPQALNYEAQRKGFKDQQQRQNAQRLVQPDPPVPVARPPVPPSGASMKAIPTLQLVQNPSDPPSTTPVQPRSASHAVPPNPFFAGSFLTLISMSGLAIFIIKLATGLSGRPKASRSRPPTLPKSAPAVPPPLPVSAAGRRTVKDLTWDDFELLVGEVYRRQGFKVELSAGTGADGGIDLVLRRGEERVLVQCKSWNVYKVSAPAIREFYGVIVSEKADRGIFVTTGLFTRDARDFAAGKPIEMIDGAAWQALLESASTDPHDDLLNVALWAPVFLAASRITVPPCPFCKGAMVKRSGRGGAFLGCSTFPRCRGKREIRKHVEI